MSGGNGGEWLCGSRVKKQHVKSQRKMVRKIKNRKRETE